MPAKMSDTIQPEYRNDESGAASMALVRGCAPRALRRAEASRVIQREAHSLVLHATREGIPADRFDWWADLRRGRLRIWGGLLRFVDSLIARGFPEHRVQIIPDLLRAYISDQYPGDDTDPSAAKKAA
jgi:hypothetical protein